jgi:hypothetical protein
LLDEVTRLRLALKLARERVAPFEQEYGVTSEHFISEMAAEDLKGSDDEYVRWGRGVQADAKAPGKVATAPGDQLR